MATLSQDNFRYNPEEGREANFREWFYQNRDEREVWGEPHLTELEAQKLFNDLFPKTVDQS
jgi:hypothetical protein